MIHPLAIKAARFICKEYGVTFKPRKDLIKRWEIRGSAISWRDIIFVDITQDPDWFLSTLFHELQHCINYKEGKYFNYHKGNASNKECKRLALRAEIYTDKRAKKLARKYGVVRYKTTYTNSKFWKEYFKERFS